MVSKIINDKNYFDKMFNNSLIQTISLNLMFEDLPDLQKIEDFNLKKQVISWYYSAVELNKKIDYETLSNDCVLSPVGFENDIYKTASLNRAYYSLDFFDVKLYFEKIDREEFTTIKISSNEYELAYIEKQIELFDKRIIIRVILNRMVTIDIENINNKIPIYLDNYSLIFEKNSMTNYYTLETTNSNEDKIKEIVFSNFKIKQRNFKMFYKVTMKDIDELKKKESFSYDKIPMIYDLKGNILSYAYDLKLKTGKHRIVNIPNKYLNNLDPSIFYIDTGKAIENYLSPYDFSTGFPIDEEIDLLVEELSKSTRKECVFLNEFLLSMDVGLKKVSDFGCYICEDFNESIFKEKESLTEMFTLNFKY